MGGKVPVPFTEGIALAVDKFTAEWPEIAGDSQTKEILGFLLEEQGGAGLAYAIKLVSCPDMKKDLLEEPLGSHPAAVALFQAIIAAVDACSVPLEESPFSRM